MYASQILSGFLTQQDVGVQRSLVGLVEDDAAVLPKQRVPKALHELQAHTANRKWINLQYIKHSYLR